MFRSEQVTSIADHVVAWRVPASLTLLILLTRCIIRLLSPNRTGTSAHSSRGGIEQREPYAPRPSRPRSFLGSRSRCLLSVRARNSSDLDHGD